MLRLNAVFYPKITLQSILFLLFVVQVAPLEVMLKQFSLSERHINHQLDKRSGHRYGEMSMLLTSNTFGLLLIRRITGKLYSVNHQ